MVTEFKRKPKPREANPNLVEQFVYGSEPERREVPCIAKAEDELENFGEKTSEEKFDKPWEQHKRKAKPKRAFTLRLNDYELELLRHVTERERVNAEDDQSMQTVVKAILIPELENRAKS